MFEPEILEQPNTLVRIRKEQEIEMKFEYERDAFMDETMDDLLPDDALTFIDLSTTSGENDTHLQATIFSPNHPDNYPNHASFNWLVRADFGKKVQFSIEQVEMELGYDLVFVHDGNCTEDHLLNLGETVGEGEVYTSTGNFMLIVFTSDRSVTMKGFRGNVKAVSSFEEGFDQNFEVVTGCSKDLLKGSGKILFRGYSPEDTECRWLITAGSNNKVKVDLDLHDVMPDCDVIKVYEGSEENELKLLAKMTSDRNATHSFESDQILIVHQFTSPHINEGMFTASYEQVESKSDIQTLQDSSEFCGGILLDDFEGGLKRIYYPLDNSHNVRNCSWTVQSFGSNRVRLHVFVSQLVHDFDSKDELRVLDGSGAQLGSERGPFSNNRHRYYQSVSDSIVIEIKSSQRSQHSQMSHFYVDYEFVSPLNFDLRSSSMTLEEQSLGSCSNKNVVYDETYIMFYDQTTHYENNMDCSWLLKSGKRSVLRLDVHGISDGDFLLVYDGDLPGDRQVANLTNAFRLYDRHFVMTSEYLYVRFVSDDVNTSAGFEMAVERRGEMADDVYY